MRAQFLKTIPRTTQLLGRTRMSTGVPSSTAQVQKRSETMASSTSPSASDLKIETTPNEATGVKLSEQQKMVVGSVLDLFKGLPTLSKLQLWTDDATFADPITIAEGRKQYSAQWYGLKAAFSQIDQLSQSVTSDKNPITIDLKTRYKLAGLGLEKLMESQVCIWTQPEGGPDGEKLRIVKVEDKWNGGALPDGPFAKVRAGELLAVMNPFWWARYAQDLGFWTLVQVWECWWWEAFRNLNSVVVPAFVSVPKTEEEDAKMQQKK